MKKLLLLTALLSFGLVFTGCIGQSVAEAEPAAPRADTGQTLIDGEKLFRNRIDIGDAKRAVATLAAARDPENRNFELEWKFARYSYFVGSRKNLDDSEAETYLKAGITAANIAKRLKPESPEGHFWYAAILGEQSKRSPVTVGTISLDKIRTAMNKVIEIDPQYQGASAYDALGQLEMGSRGLAGGSVEKAIGHFEKALEVDSDNSYTRLHLGEAYWAAGRKEDARTQLQMVLSMKTTPGFEAEHAECKKDAQKLLDTKF